MNHNDENKKIDALLKKAHGPLSLESIKIGLDYCLLNAQELIADAKLLYEHTRFPRAVSLSLSALEEIGKMQVLTQMSQTSTHPQSAWHELWKAFRSHERKSTAGFTASYSDEIRDNPKRWFQAVGEQQSIAPLAERFRQLGIYVDYYMEENSWLLPSKQIDKAYAYQRINVSQAAVTRYEQLRDRGMFEMDVLQLQRELYAELHLINIKDLKPGSESADFWKKIQATHKRFFSRLVELGKVELDSTLKIHGTPISEFIK